MTEQPVTMNRRILVIDDNPAIHGDIRKILAADNGSDALQEDEAILFGTTAEARPDWTFEINSAFQGDEGVQLVRQALEADRRFAMAVVDVRMPPGWDGIETISHLWEVDPSVQVVLCSAYSDYSWNDMIRKLGETEKLLILKKPFDNIEVRQLASALCGKWNLERHVQAMLDRLENSVDERTRKLGEQRLELELAHGQLLHAQKMESIGQLAAGIAHEINTPTQFIGDNIRFLETGFGDLMKMLDVYAEALSPDHGGRPWNDRIAEIGKAMADCDVAFLKEEVPKAIQQTLNGVERVATIVRSMKEFSHPGAKEKGATDLNRAIQSTITVAGNEWKYVAEMETELDPALPPVPCVAGDINQVVLNLIINAAHAITDVVGDSGSEKGIITVATRQDGDHAEIRIRDTGTGIPEHLQSRIFDPFFTTKEVGKGTGQGLAIAHDVIVRKHRGTLSCESEVGRGTTFIVRLPMEPTPVEAAELGA